VHPYKNVLGMVHCPGSNGKRLHRNTEPVDIYFGDAG
jgi:hypothetical protein